MAGELWRSVFQIGKETTAGTPVAATRKGYFSGDSVLKREREARLHKFQVARRTNQLAHTLGPVMVKGSLKQPLSANEAIELLLATINGGVTPTGAGTVKTWTFAPGNTLDPLTLEWDDGARPWRASGVYGSKIKISGSVKDMTTVEADVMGLSMAQNALTGALADRVPTFIEGWETTLYIDAFGGTAGTTAVNGTLVNWEVELDNKMEHEHFAQNSINAGVITVGEIDCKAKLTFRADPAIALTEFNNWDAQTKRLVQLKFGDNVVISGGDKEFVKVNLPGAWSAVDLGASNQNSRMYELSLDYVYDTTNAYGLQIICQNARATAY
jgi:hypothetical protein